MPTTTTTKRTAEPPFEFEITATEANPAAAVRHEATLPPGQQPVLSIRASVPKADASAFIADALHDIRVFMQEHHLRAAGPPFSICRPRGVDVDVEAGWPTVGAPPGTSRIHAGALPRSLAGPPDNPTSTDTHGLSRLGANSTRSPFSAQRAAA